ncbi:MAG: hypothetical protein CM15mP25_2910 [Gammaproteobacteria bacterium]|nr:MAG: hypothetical protein CM15mP25_2910 [Gammaproteobacteria bacterium]
MKLKFIAFLTLLFCYPVVFAEPLASASYKDVCEQMDQQGISSRTQLDPSSQQLVDNVVVVVGAGKQAAASRLNPSPIRILSWARA